MLAMPPAVLDLLNLQAGAMVGVAIDGGRLVIEPHRSKYTLYELLAQCDSSAEISPEDREWLTERPVGTELI